jgi:hypothetical protein
MDAPDHRKTPLAAVIVGAEHDRKAGGSAASGAIWGHRAQVRVTNEGGNGESAGFFANISWHDS